MEQYRMCELCFPGAEPEEGWAQVDLRVSLRCGDAVLNVTGFYAGDGVYKARFLPSAAGVWQYRTEGCVQAEGEVTVKPAETAHGKVTAEGTHFRYEDGTPYYPFGTTVYALMHQEDALVAETFGSLKSAPFNKIRFCVFPKHYDYNHNEPPVYAFEKKEDGSWDVNRPCLPFWDRLDAVMDGLEKLDIQADLILFHPYDRWGFGRLTQEENLIYLDYLTRRLSARPNLWWSLANEYDLCAAKTEADWCEIEEFLAAHDPFRHLLSCHNCLKTWDYSRANVTHASVQTKYLTGVARWRRMYQKPVVVDECCYEGDIEHIWGSISGREMTNRFWRVVTMGGYCTHGETFLSPDEVLWWARGGRLKGESPARIAFLRSIVEELPGALEPVESDLALLMDAGEPEESLKAMEPGRAFFVRKALEMGERLHEFVDSEYMYEGHCGEEAYLVFYDLRTCRKSFLRLPETKTYRVELIDTWNMTREVLLEGASGRTELTLPGKEGMAVLATAAGAKTAAV